MSDAPLSSRRPHRGALILVLGILGLVACMPLGIAAWVMGRSDLDSIRRGEIDADGEGMTKAGMILGIISVVWVCLILLLVGTTIGFGACVAGISTR